MCPLPPQSPSTPVPLSTQEPSPLVACCFRETDWNKWVLHLRQLEQGFMFHVLPPHDDIKVRIPSCNACHDPTPLLVYLFLPSLSGNPASSADRNYFGPSVCLIMQAIADHIPVDFPFGTQIIFAPRDQNRCAGCVSGYLCLIYD
jgi:hypothetical protein